jgi:uncharacterized protein YbdZ (MbtH family)
MKSEIKYVPDKNIILSKFSGEIFLRSVKDSATEGLLLSQKTECHKFIIDLTESIINISFPEVIIFIEGLWRMVFSSKDRVAFIIKKEENDYTFWETAAVNRGWGKIGFFTSQEEAEKWIL